MTLKIPVYRKWDIKTEEGPDGLVAVAVKGDGIRIYGRQKDSLLEKHAVTTETGLKSNSVFSIVFDKKKRLWVLSDFGVSVVDLNIFVSDSLHPLNNLGSLGLTATNWEQAVMGLSHTGKMIVGSPSATAVIDIDSFQVLETSPKIFIESLQVQKVNSDEESNPLFLKPVGEMVLNENQNSFKLKFQSVSFSEVSELIYSYRLKNNDDSNWSTATNSTSVTFLNLAPGKYSFEVRSRKPNTNWSQPAKLGIHINPPFWRTTLFKLIILLNIIFIISFAFQLRLRKVRKSAFLNSKLSELEMKALRAQMNPHFIYNALNSIQSLIAAGKQKDAMRYVSKFGKLLRLILEYSEEGKTTLQKELDVNSLYIELEQLRLGFDFAVNIAIAENIIPEEEKVPALILQPVIENALWHGLTNIKDDKHLFIDVSATETHLIIGVTDNGPGIDTAQKNPKSSEKRKSFGSQIVRKRLLTYNNDHLEPVHIRDLKEIGKQGTEVKIFIRKVVQ